MEAGSSLLRFSDLPEFRVDSDNIALSFKQWFTRFNIAIKRKIKEQGTHKVTMGGNEQVVDRFDEESKVLALLSCVGDDGLEVLSSQGIDLDSDELKYDDLVKKLKSFYAQAESVNVLTQRFVTLA